MVEKEVIKKAYAYYNQHQRYPGWELIFDYQRDDLFKANRNEKLFIYRVPYPDYLPGEVVYLLTKYWFRSARIQEVTPGMRGKAFAGFHYHFDTDEVIYNTDDKIFSSSIDAFFYVISQYFDKLVGLFER